MDVVLLGECKQTVHAAGYLHIVVRTLDRKHLKQRIHEYELRVGPGVESRPKRIRSRRLLPRVEEDNWVVLGSKSPEVLRRHLRVVFEPGIDHRALHGS